MSIAPPSWVIRWVGEWPPSSRINTRIAVNVWCSWQVVGSRAPSPPSFASPSAPFAEFVLPLLQLPVGRIGARAIIETLRVSGHDLGRDAEELKRVFDAFPDTAARVAFTRTLRSVVDWRGQVVTLRDRCYLAEAMPIMIVWGTRDAVIPVHHAHLAHLAHLAHAAMPGSDLVLFEDAGHFPHHADRDRFVTELNHFIEANAPSRHEPERWRELMRKGAPRAESGPIRPKRRGVSAEPAGATTGEPLGLIAVT